MGNFWVIFILFFALGSNAQVTFHKDVAPILKKHCISCHSKGEIGPMPLVTYEEVSSYASMIAFVTKIKLMPPFKADYHKVSYKNERSISKEEIATIETWIDEGLLEGESITNKPDTKASKKKYDEIICMEESFEHYGIYYDQYQAFVLPTDLVEDKYISQIDIIPDNREIVRSAYISVAKKGDAKAMDNWDPKYGFYAYGSLGFEATMPNWHSWMPNTKGLELEDNEYNLLPNHSELILHLHYGPFGEIQTDSTCIGLNFTVDIRDKIQVQNVPLMATEFLSDSFFIEPDLKKRVTSQFYIPEDIYIKSITPLSYLLCRNWEVFAVLPDKSSLPLLSISDWDFHWRERYVFQDYIFLPQGTRVVGTATYDNTSNNPYNPSDPPHGMKKGPHMFDENFLCYFEFVHPNTDRSATIKKPYTVSKTNFPKLEFNCHKSGNYKIWSHNLSSGKSTLLSEKKYSIGNHSLQVSNMFEKNGRYAISISLEDEVQDIWIFVVK